MPAGNKPGSNNGGGRRKGVPNKASAVRVERAAQTGVLPADVMLDNMRYHWKKAVTASRRKPSKLVSRKEIDEDIRTHRQLAQAAAVDAAPYYHNRLSAVEVSGLGKGPIESKVTGTVVHTLDKASIDLIEALVK